MTDPRLHAGSTHIIDFPLCEARLQDDARWPWIVLIPRRPNLREIEDLDQRDQAALLAEVVAASVAVRAAGEALGRPVGKLNIGQLGNIVPQLHIHVVGRRDDDPAWPGPVWGVGTATAYTAQDLATAMEAVRTALR